MKHFLGPVCDIRPFRKYRVVGISCPNHAKWLHQIQRYNNSPPSRWQSKWPLPHSVNTGVKKTPDSPFLSFLIAPVRYKCDWKNMWPYINLLICPFSLTWEKKIRFFSFQLQSNVNDKPFFGDMQSGSRSNWCFVPENEKKNEQFCKKYCV